MRRKSERHALSGDVWHCEYTHRTWIIVGKGSGYMFEKVWAALDVDTGELIQRAAFIDLKFGHGWKKIAP